MRFESKAASGIMLTLFLTSVLTLAFDIQPVRAEPGAICIRADGSVEGTDKIQRDGNIYSFSTDIYDSITVEKNDIIVNGNGYTLQGTGTGDGFYLHGTTNVTIKNVRINLFYAGIHLLYSASCIIAENTVSSNSHGINLYQSTSCAVRNNTVTSNQGGIIVYQGSNHIIVENNNVSSNSVEGIDVGMANWCIIAHNNLANNLFGIWLSHSSDNMLFGNVIRNSSFGMRLDSSPENTIYHNNFIDNTNQAIVFGESFNNVWDDSYPNGGNYWSDYADVDLYGGPDQDYPSGSDGLGDSSYVIDANNQDRYPLMSPWIERIVGVRAGDWTRYKYEFAWSSTDPNEQPPQDLVDIVTHLDWYGINVLDVYDTTIDFQTIIHFKNGTETTSYWTVDINDGSGNGTYLQAFIAAGLNPGEALCTFPPQFTWCGWEVEETILRPYVGVMRETTHLNVTDWSFVGRYLPLEFDSIDGFYWDRATGIIYEHAHEQSFESDGYVTSLSYTMKIVDANLWENPFPYDLNYDEKVDIRDIATAALAFGSYIGHSRWNPQADINQDGNIDIRDLVLIAKNFGKTYQ